MNTSPSTIRLPVLHRFSVTDYALYPGREDNGLHAEVQPGVNIVVGINGLGKTTLLNALFRTLSGPVEWSSRPLEGPAGTTPPDLGPWQNTTFFQRRVPDSAKSARVRATVGFGERTIEVERRLATLDLASLRVDGEHRPNSEEEYQRAVCDLANVSTFEDFYLILRYLVFFLEDRQPLFWDPRAQSDTLQVLFYDLAASRRLGALASEIQQMDSEYRNTRYALGKHEKRLRSLLAENAKRDSDAQKIGLLEAQITGVRQRVEEETKTLQSDEARYATQRRELDVLRVDLERRVRTYEASEQTRFLEIYPDLATAAGYIYTHVVSGGGCLLCGDRSTDAQIRARALIEAGRCPNCLSEPNARETYALPVLEPDPNLTSLDQAITELQTRVRPLKVEVQELEEMLHTKRRNLALGHQELAAAEREYEELTGGIPTDSGELKELQSFIATGERYLTRLQATRQEREAEYGGLLEAGRARVQDIADQVVERFGIYAAAFLADDARLLYAPLKQRLGQMGTAFTFPHFNIELASGVFQHTLKQRNAPFEVSESQREFIDLAFRMALISVASGIRAAMLVLETPEASLDAIFIPRAGRLLGHFASIEGENRLIATCNLNQTEMIPALFGAAEAPQDLSNLPVQLIPPEKRRDHLINLLRDARANNALRKYGDEYEEEFLSSVYPDVQRDDRPSLHES